MPSDIGYLLGFIFIYRNNWWLRSVHSGSSSNVCNVNNNGNANNNDATNTWERPRVGFLVGTRQFWLISLHMASRGQGRENRPSKRLVFSSINASLGEQPASCMVVVLYAYHDCIVSPYAAYGHSARDKNEQGRAGHLLSGLL